MRLQLSKINLGIFFVAVWPFVVLAQSPHEYLECPQIKLSETLTIESQGALDPDLQIRDAENKVVGSLEIDRDLMFRISGLQLLDNEARPIAAYQHHFFGKPIFNICSQKQIARVEVKGVSGFTVFGTDGNAMYRVVLDTDSAPNGFKVYAGNVRIAEATKSGDHVYRVKITNAEMRKDDLLPLIFGLAVYSMSDWELSEDLRPLDDIVW